MLQEQPAMHEPASETAALPGQMRPADQLSSAFRGDRPETAALALRGLLPGAQVEVGRDVCYIARRTIDAKDWMYAAALRGLLESAFVAQGRAVCVQDFSLPKQDILSLHESNIVSDATPPEIRDKYYDRLVEGCFCVWPTLTRGQRDEYLFAPAAARLAAGRLVSFDHHYQYKVLTTTCSTVLSVDFADYLQRNRREDLLHRFENAYSLMDHCDADMLLAQFARRSASDRAFLAAHGELLKDAARLNDFGELRGCWPHSNSVHMLYCVMRGLERRIDERQCSMEYALAAVRSGVEFAAKYGATVECDVLYNTLALSPHGMRGAAAIEREHMQNLVLGVKFFKDECERWQAMAADYNPNDRKVRPGAITKLGRLLFAYVPDDGREQENMSLLLFLRLHRPDMLEGVDVVASSSPLGEGRDRSRPRMFRLRSFIKPDGTYTDLCELVPFFPGAGGRSFAIGLSKGPIWNLDVAKTAAVAADALSRRHAREQS